MWLRFNPAKDSLFLDIDGTLLDIAPTAQDVKAPPSLIENLGRLNDKLKGALAFVSGRMVHEIDQLFNPLKLRCAGAHGAEWRLSPEGPVGTGGLLPDKLRDDIAIAFDDDKGIIVEDKIYNVAVHYRQAPEKKNEIRKKLFALVNEYRDKVILINGRKVFEVSLVTNNKGKAIERMLKMPPFKGRRPVFLGDDTADIAAIATCMKSGGIAVLVGKGDANQKSAFASPEQVRSWIGQISAETTK